MLPEVKVGKIYVFKPSPKIKKNTNYDLTQKVVKLFKYFARLKTISKKVASLYINL